VAPLLLTAARVHAEQLTVHGNDHEPILGQLLHELVWHGVRLRRHENAVERRLLGQT
jgi:hypothetical protein